jgi:hypothetical protein
MEENNTLNTPYNQSLNDQADNIFVLINIVNTLLETTRSADLSDAHFVRLMLSELQWIQRQTYQVNETVELILNSNPDNPMIYSLRYMIQQATLEIEHVKQAVSQLCFSTLKERQSLPNYRDRLNTILHSLYLMLNRLYHDLKLSNNEIEGTSA